MSLPLLAGAACLAAYFLFSQIPYLLVTGIFGVAVGFIAGAVVAIVQPGRQARLGLDTQTDERARLKRALSRLKYETGVDTLAEQALSELEQLQARFALFEDALASKMSPKELTYERYHSTATQVRDAITQNLQTVLLSIQMVHAMPESNPARAAELSRLKALFAANELGLTRLDEATHAISEIKTSRDSAAANLEATLKELQELAARASKYSTQ